jgi:hypothetical protein
VGVHCGIVTRVLTMCQIRHTWIPPATVLLYTPASNSWNLRILSLLLDTDTNNTNKYTICAMWQMWKKCYFQDTIIGQLSIFPCVALRVPHAMPWVELIIQGRASLHWQTSMLSAAKTYMIYFHCWGFSVHNCSMLESPKISWWIMNYLDYICIRMERDWDGLHTY